MYRKYRQLIARNQSVKDVEIVASNTVAILLSTQLKDFENIKLIVKVWVGRKFSKFFDRQFAKFIPLTFLTFRTVFKF